MLVTETITVKREIHVAPCLECGHTDILLSDSGYSSFNVGGGECKRCHHKTTASVGCDPKMTELAAIWNAGNDIPTLIKVEEAKITQAQKRIAELKVKAGPSIHLKPFSGSDERCLMTAAEFEEGEESGGLTSEDGSGYWATATQRSDISTSQPRPDWATHVVWFNR